MQTNGVLVFDDELPAFLTRREKKLQKRKVQSTRKETPTIQVKNFHPLTENQKRTYSAFDTDQNLLLHGSAGTGKTFLALYLSLRCIMRGDAPKPIVILRSVVPSRDMGFLPGKMEEKSAVYEEPYRGLCAEICGHPTAYDYLKRNNYIQFSTTSFLRGMTFRDNIVIVDEAQNCSGHELNTIMTRIGEGCRMIVCADFTQTDLQRSEEKSGFRNFMKIAQNMRSFEHVEFTREDIVRSSFVKEYIETKEQLGLIL